MDAKNLNNINYIQGDATQPVGDGNKIIAHVCNDIGGWGKGFVVAISKRWPQPEQDFREWYANREDNDFALGSARLVQVEKDLWVANMIGQHKKTPTKGVPPVRYEAIREALDSISDEASRLNASVHMPRIGCGLAGGEWDKIEPLIKQTLCDRDIAVSVYDWKA
ncbi:MAG: macro domain-containing protein [Planctomycetota bacterium]